MSSARSIASVAPSVHRATENLRVMAPRKVELSMIRLVSGHNPRGFALGEHAFAGDAFLELVDSLRSYGDVLVPILLRPAPGKTGIYELVSGERRFRAAKEAGLEEISCEIRNLDDDQMFEAALAENEIREDVAKIDRILACLHALSARCGVPTGELRTWFIRLRKVPVGTAFEPDSVEERLTVQMRRLGMPGLSTLVRSWSRYLDLTPEERLALRHGLPEEAALKLLDLKSRPERASLLERAVQESWTAAQMDRAVRDVLDGQDVLDAQDAGQREVRVNPVVARKVRGLLSASALAKLGPDLSARLQGDLELLLQKYALPDTSADPAGETVS